MPQRPQISYEILIIVFICIAVAIEIIKFTV